MKDLTVLSKDELIAYIKGLHKQKKYGLVWEAKTEALVEECKSKLPVLKEDASKVLSSSPTLPTNILIEGDNYHALSVLNYTHLGKIDVIYIDPPYNTGNEDFKYNDRWVDVEDGYRHSKWLNFMEKRLLLAKNLLSENGVIFISIDDNEQARLKLLCDQVFGEKNNELFIWRKVGNGDAGAGKMKRTYRFRLEHEYVIVCYLDKEKTRFFKTLNLPNFKNQYSNPDRDVRGAYKAGNISQSEDKSKKTGKNFYTVTSPGGKNFSRQWHFDQSEFVKLDKDNRIYWGKDKNNVPAIKIFISELRPTIPVSILDNYGSATSASKKLINMFGTKTFDNPKPLELITYFLQISTRLNSTILDFFAGSGTTGHAVLDLNKQDGGNRQFILCTNNEGNICTDICYPRIQKVIAGYGNAPGIPANLRYLKTAFIPAEITDENKKKLADGSTEMLCLKEGCFDEVVSGLEFKIFQGNGGKYLGVIYDYDGVQAFKKAVLMINQKVVTYLFSLGESEQIEEFVGMEHLVDLCPIPTAILNVYKRMFK